MGYKTMSKLTDDFIKKYLPYAQALDRATKGAIPASLSLGQAAEETGWGQHMPNNNPFGIKGVGDAGTAFLPSAEYENGSYVIRTSGFAAYSDITSSFEGYASRLSNKRYNAAFKTNDSTEMIKEIHKAGYANNPDYTKNVTNIINGYNLKQYDSSYVAASTKSTSKPVDIKDVKIDGAAILRDAGVSDSRTTVVESVFGDPKEGDDWRKIAHDRENALNPPTDPAGFVDDVKDAVSAPFKAAMSTGVKVLIILVLVIALIAMIVLAIPKPSAATVAKAVL